MLGKIRGKKDGRKENGGKENPGKAGEEADGGGRLQFGIASNRHPDLPPSSIFLSAIFLSPLPREGAGRHFPLFTTKWKVPACSPKECLPAVLPRDGA
jgi:hypothetical protein